MLITLAALLLAPLTAQADTSAQVSAKILALPSNACGANPGEVAKLIREWREAKRLEFTEAFSKQLPSVLRWPQYSSAAPKTGSCLNNKDWRWGERGAGDFYVAQCLMSTKGGGLYLMKFELDVPYASCVSNETINTEINSQNCKTFPGYAQQWFTTKIQNPGCTVGNLPPPGQAPTFRSPPRAEVMDVVVFNRLLNQGKDVDDVAEIQDGRVVLKKGVSTSSGGDEPPPINVNNSKDVK